ncbi:hypothetical protein QR680_012430 [Steinernema hermaphroditum]|uniref:G-protein coupled receptors family 1 profile domain-containing protein n=1 Tax=Steinernema hermaphroditum TaxID=289476 RepID=A0AA39M0Q8_9BILA|nr:hypothetical protein QR680_012430 [Steinernema hermaphroditum]
MHLILLLETFPVEACADLSRKVSLNTPLRGPETPSLGRVPGGGASPPPRPRDYFCFPIHSLQNPMMSSEVRFDLNCIGVERYWYTVLEFIFTSLPNVLFVCILMAIVANVIFLAGIVLGVYQHKLPTKRFLFVANRSLIDTVVAIVSLAFLTTVESECDILGCTSTYQVPDIIMQSMMTLNYWVIAASYFGVALLTCYAVRAPLKYKIWLSVKRVTQFISVGWALMILLLVCISLSTEQQTNFDSNGMMYIMRNQYHGFLAEWMVELCGRVIDKSLVQTGTMSLFLPVCTYLMAVLSYIFVTILLFRRRQDPRMANRHRMCIWRLGVHLGVFTFSFALMAVSYSATFPMAMSCADWSRRLTNMTDYRSSSECEIGHMTPFVRYAILTSLASVGWFLRMTLDPIIDMVIDAQLRRVFEVITTGTRRGSSFTMASVVERKCSNLSVSRYHETVCAAKQ